MAFTTKELTKYREEMDAFIASHRPPEHLRDKVDLSYSIEEQSIVIFEVRPRWDNPTEKQQSPVAKTTYVRTQNLWRVFWMRSDLKWHSYPATPEVQTLNAFLAEVDADAHGCFRG